MTHNHDKDKDNNHVMMFNNHNNDGDHYNDDCVKNNRQYILTTETFGKFTVECYEIRKLNFLRIKIFEKFP